MARHRTDYLWVAPALLVMVLVIGYPFVYTIDLSFYDTPPSSANWYFNGVGNYTQILSDPAFWAVTLNTAYWAVGSTILAFAAPDASDAVAAALQAAAAANGLAADTMVAPADNRGAVLV